LEEGILKKSILLAVTMSFSAFAQSSEPGPLEPVDYLGLEVLTVLSRVAVQPDTRYDVESFFRSGNSVTEATAQRYNRASTVYRLTIKQCKNIPGGVGCMGGSRLTITRNQRATQDVAYTYDTKIERFR
jgi:hypothetical protein